MNLKTLVPWKLNSTVKNLQSATNRWWWNSSPASIRVQDRSSIHELDSSKALLPRSLDRHPMKYEILQRNAIQEIKICSPTTSNLPCAQSLNSTALTAKYQSHKALQAQQTDGDKTQQQAFKWKAGILISSTVNFTEGLACCPEVRMEWSEYEVPQRVTSLEIDNSLPPIDFQLTLWTQPKTVVPWKLIPPSNCN